MTFNFDTYSANVQYTPKSGIAFTNLDPFKNIALELPSIAFKHDKSKIEEDTSSNHSEAEYAVQLFYITYKSPAEWAALVGFTWKRTRDVGLANS